MRGCFTGLGPVVAIVLGGLLVGGLVIVQCDRANTGVGRQEELGAVAFTMDGEPVYQTEVQFAVNIQMQALSANRPPGAQSAGPSPAEELDMLINSVNANLQRAAIIGIAKDKGLDTSEDQLPGWLQQETDNHLDGERQEVERSLQEQTVRLQVTLALSREEKGADSDEFKESERLLREHKAKTLDQFYIQYYGFSEKEHREFREQRDEAALASPLDRRSQLALMLQQALLGQYRAAVDTPDDEVRASYDEFTYQQLLVSPEDDQDPVAKAEEILGRIRDGMKFEVAVVRFSGIEPTDDQAPEEAGTETYDRLTLLSSPGFSFLEEMDPGEVSDVIELVASAAIYRVIQIEPGAPEDFDAQKESRALGMRQALGDRLLGEALEERVKAARIEWQDESYRLVRSYGDLRSGERAEELRRGENKQERIEAYREILEEAKEAVGDARILALLSYVAIGQIAADTPPGPEKEALDEERLRVYREIEFNIRYLPFVFEYAELLIAAGDGDEALEQLKEIPYSLLEFEENEAMIDRLEAMLPEAERHASEGSTVADEVREEIDRWRKGLAEFQADREEDEGGEPAPPAEAGSPDGGNGAEQTEENASPDG